MVQAKFDLSHARLRGGLRAAVGVWLAAALSACSLLTASEPEVRSYEYRPAYGYVRIERIERGAPDNAHPFTVSAGALKQWLAALKVKGSLSLDAKPIFNNEELDEFALPLASALAKVGPKDDVTFTVVGNHGVFGIYSPRTYTSGRLFMRDGQLNVVFGIMHEPNDMPTNGSGVPPMPGSRARRIEGVWNIVVPNGVRLADNRGDWVIVDTAAMPVAAPAAEKEKQTGPVTTSTPESRSQEIENKLRVLDHLKARGMITDDEYRERRRAILQGI